MINNQIYYNHSVLRI